MCVHELMLAHVPMQPDAQALEDAGSRLRAKELSEQQAQERINELVAEISSASENAALSLQVRCTQRQG